MVQDVKRVVVVVVVVANVWKVVGRLLEDGIIIGRRSQEFWFWLFGYGIVITGS